MQRYFIYLKVPPKLLKFWKFGGTLTQYWRCSGNLPTCVLRRGGQFVPTHEGHERAILTPSQNNYYSTSELNLRHGSILRLLQVFFEKSEEKVFPSIQRCSLWIFIALIGASRPWPRGYPWLVSIGGAVWEWRAFHTTIRVYRWRTIDQRGRGIELFYNFQQTRGLNI